MKQKVYIIVSIVIILIVCLLEFYFYTNSLQDRLDSELERLRAIGCPVTLKELDNWYTAVPDNENAALIYEKAFPLIQAYPSLDKGKIILKGDPPFPPLGEPFSDEIIAANKKYIGINSSFFRLIKEASKKDKARYSIDYANGKLFGTWGFKNIDRLNACKLLLIKTNILAEETNQKKCLKSIKESIHFVKSLQNEPPLISHVMYLSSTALLCQTLERVLSRVQFSGQQLQELQQKLSDIDLKRSEKRAFIADMTLFIATDWKKQISPLMGGMGSLRGYIKRQTFKISSIEIKNKLKYIALMNSFIYAIKQPYPEAKELMEKTEDQNRNSLGFQYSLVKMMFPSLSTIHTMTVRCTAMLKNTITVLALERFRLNNGHLPKTLNELVPKYLTSLPIDPFTGEKLKYKIGSIELLINKEDPHTYEKSYKKNITKLPKALFIKRYGYIVYSVDRDCQDNDGNDYLDNKDIPFRKLTQKD